VRTYRSLFGAVAVGWLVLDQLTKTWAVHVLTGPAVSVVWTLQFDLAYNSGASFSMGTGMGPWIALGVVGVVAFLVWSARSVSSRMAAVAMGMIVGGALGNLGDRMFRGDIGFLHGSVVDFIDFQWWPVFNVADIGVVCGAILLVTATLRGAGS
jgi:signal peptidase II